MQGKRGFNLIEVIAVLVCLAIVMAVIVFPMFSRHPHPNRDRAYCQSNLKQISLGLAQYVQDYDGIYCPSVGDGSAPTACSDSYGWAGALFPYLKSAPIFQCPAETTQMSAAGACAKVGPQWTDYTDYPFNGNLSQRKQTDLPSPRSIVLFQDGAIGGGDGTYVANTEVTISTKTARHLECNNFAFADGHVKWLKPGKVRSGTTGCGGTNRPAPTTYSFCIN